MTQIKAFIAYLFVSVLAVSTVATDIETVGVEPAGIDEVLYKDQFEVFDAVHNKIILAFFGKHAFYSFIEPAVDSYTLATIKELPDVELDTYAAPFSLKISNVVNTMLFGFFALSAFYLIAVNFKFYLERITTLVTTSDNDSGMKTVGGNHALRFLATMLVFTPLLPVIFNFEEKAVEFETSEIGANSPTMMGFFGVIGEFFALTERTSRSFVGDSSVYSPHYFVPTPAAKRVEFEHMMDFAFCVANEDKEVELDIKSELINSELEGVYSNPHYHASYKECNLYMTARTDNKTLEMLRKDSDLVKLSGATDEHYESFLLQSFKAKMDAYLKIALTATVRLSNEYYSTKNPEDKLAIDTTIDMSNWHERCDDIIALTTNDSYIEAFHATKLLSRCFSLDYIKTFAYPLDVDDFDVKAMDSEDESVDGSRFTPICKESVLGDSFAVNIEQKVLADCVKKVCSFDTVTGEFGSGATGLFQCSVGINSLAKSMGVSDYTRKGFLFSPSYNQHSFGVEITDSSKAPISTLSGRYVYVEGDADFTFLNRGDTVFTSELERSRAGDAEMSFYEVISAQSLTPANKPTFSKYDNMGFTDLVAATQFRFSTCLGKAGRILPEFGACGTSYQEAARLIGAYQEFLVVGIFANFASNKYSKYKEKRAAKKIDTTHGGFSDAATKDEAKKVAKKNKGKAKNTKSGVKKAQTAQEMLSGGSSLGSAVDVQTGKVIMMGLATLGLPEVYDAIKSFNTMNEVVDTFIPKRDIFRPDSLALQVDSIATETIGTLIVILSGAFKMDIVGGLLITLLTGFLIFTVIVSVSPVIIFFLAMIWSLLNLLAFYITLPFQLANAFSDTGEDIPKHMKKLTLKFILTTIRFSVTVIGFWLAFALFDTSISVYLYALEFAHMRTGESDLMMDAMAMCALGALYIAAVCTCVAISMNAIKTTYELVKAFLNDNSSTVAPEEAEMVLGTLKRIFK